MTADAATKPKKPKPAEEWCVLKRSNGHAETLKPEIQIFTTEQEAIAECESLILKYPGQVFARFRQIGCTRPRTPFETV